MSERRRCSTSAGNKLMKRETGGNSPGGNRKGGGGKWNSNSDFALCVEVCVRMCRPGAHVCVWSTVGIGLQ